MTQGMITFAGADFAAGAIAALVLAFLMRVRIVAISVATVLALGMVSIAFDVRGPGAALDDVVQMFGRLFASGALTGAMLATTATAFLKSLVKGLTRSSGPHPKKKGMR